MWWVATLRLFEPPGTWKEVLEPRGKFAARGTAVLQESRSSLFLHVVGGGALPACPSGSLYSLESAVVLKT